MKSPGSSAQLTRAIGISILVGFAVLYVLAACQPSPSAGRQLAQNSGIEDEHVVMTEPEETLVASEPINLENCNGTRDLQQTLGATASVSRGTTVASKATVAGGAEIAIPETVRLKLELALERAYEDQYQAAISRLDTFQMKAAPKTHVIYDIAWYQRTYSGMVEYTADGRVYQAAYTYKLRVPKIARSRQEDCYGNPNANGGMTSQATPTGGPTQVATPSPTAARQPAPPPVPATPTLVPTSTPPASPTPDCGSGCVLYEANWSKGSNGWGGSKAWKTVAGKIVNDGTVAGSVVSAPYEPGADGIADYAVEAEIQALRDPITWCEEGFGIQVRTGYFVGMDVPGCGNKQTAANIGTQAHWNGSAGSPVAQKNYSLGTEAHVYRVEVRGNEIRFMIDGTPVLQAKDNRFLEGGRVGLWSDTVSVEVRRFRVIKL